MSVSDGPNQQVGDVRGLRSGSRSRLLFLCGVVGFLYFQLFLPSGTPIFLNGDHWLFLEDAQRIVTGGTLYRDIFGFVFPGSHLFFAVLLKIFGARIWIPNAVLVLLGGLAAWLTVAISCGVLTGQRILLQTVLVVSFEFFSWHVATHNWFSSLAAMGAVLVAMKGRSPARLAGGGVLCGLATWFTQTRGAFAALGLILFLFWERRQEGGSWRALLASVGYVVGGFALTVIAATAYFVWKAGLGPFLASTIVFPIRYCPREMVCNSQVYLMDALGLRWWEAWPIVFTGIALPIVYACFPLSYRRRAVHLPRDQRAGLALVYAVGLCMLASVAPSPSWYRLGTVSAPGFVLMVWMLSSGQRVPRAILWILGFAGILCAGTALLKTARREAHSLATLDLPTGRVASLDPGLHGQYRWLRERTNPGDYFFGGRSGYFYFPLKLQPPSDVLFVTASGYTRPQQVARLVAGLEAHRVRFVVWDLRLRYPQYYEPADDHLGPLRRYLHGHYLLVKVFSVTGDEAWKRQP